MESAVFAVFCHGLWSTLNTPTVLSDLHQGQEVMQQVITSAAKVVLLWKLLHLLCFVVVCGKFRSHLKCRLTCTRGKKS